MGDFMADKNQSKSIFDSFKFWGQRPRHRDSLSKEIENSPTITIEDVAVDHTIEDRTAGDTPKEKRDEVNSGSVKLYETMNGSFIITRGWDGNNMMLYKIRRRNY
jgi:hypothetical protein